MGAWNILSNDNAVARATLSSRYLLYEPMIKLFERGESFNIRQGEMVVGSSAYPLKYWRHLNISVQDISDIELNHIE